MNGNAPTPMQTEDLIVLEDKHADQHDHAVVMDENTIILAAGDAYSLFNLKALEAAREDADLSYQDISEKMHISLSTVYKFFARKSKNPSFYNTFMIFKAIGVSIDEFCGLRPEMHYSAADDYLSRIDAMRETIASLQRTIEAQNKQIDELIGMVRDMQ